MNKIKIAISLRKKAKSVHFYYGGERTYCGTKIKKQWVIKDGVKKDITCIKCLSFNYDILR